ncbi:MAG TPA: TetR/AcrR family transcriptional regulator [Candidatus Dormibacteraeota bacterium]|jgi:AcrR family transcriptional regulator
MSAIATPQSRRQLSRERTRAEILDAAWELCRSGGLASLNLRELAAAVGMQAPSLYTHFGSKMEIYDAMFAQGYVAALEVTPAAVVDARSRADAERQFREGIRRFVDFCLEDTARYQLLFQRTIPGFVPSAASMELANANLGRGRDGLAQLGLTTPEALDLLTSVITGLVDQQISNDPGGRRWVRLTDDMLDMYLSFAIRRWRKPNRRS